MTVKNLIATLQGAIQVGLVSPETEVKIYNANEGLRVITDVGVNDEGPYIITIKIEDL